MNDNSTTTTKGATGASLGGLLLDSSLIGQTSNKKQYNIKLINCNGYIQIYEYDSTKYIKNKSLENISNDWKIEQGKIVSNKIINKKISNTKTNKIRSDNITRSKLSVQRIAKANCEYFKSFFTLTIAENIKDINVANKIFNNWRTKIKKVFPEFKYICVPEYQKRGAVHYHLLSNLELKSNLITLQKGKSCMYDIKYWNYGFSSARSTNNINIVGYMSKYMTKDIDNRLFGHKRYFYSKNLILPKQEFLDISNKQEMKYVNNLLKDKVLKYCNVYQEKITESNIFFREYMINC